MSKYIARRPSYPQRHEMKHIPKKIIDDNMVEALFSKILTGSYREIMEYVSIHNTTLNVTNKEGDNPLHIILKNSSDDITEDQVYQLVKYFVDNGVSVGEFSTSNVTPLHLAAKHQYPRVVAYLLECGADPNTQDNQAMSPMHYATNGLMVACKIPKKVGALIPEPEKEKLTPKELKNLTVLIIDLLNMATGTPAEPNFSQYITHIRRSISNIGDIYADDIDAIKKELLDSIATTVSEIDMIGGGDKISRQVNNARDKIIHTIMNKLKSSMDSLAIQPDQHDGWGPVTNNFSTYVLPKAGNPKEELASIDGDYNKKYTDVMDSLEDSVNDDLGKLSNNLDESFTQILRALVKIYQFNLHAEYNIGVDPAAPAAVAAPGRGASRGRGRGAPRGRGRGAPRGRGRGAPPIGRGAPPIGRGRGRGARGLHQVHVGDWLPGVGIVDANTTLPPGYVLIGGRRYYQHGGVPQLFENTRVSWNDLNNLLLHQDFDEYVAPVDPTDPMDYVEINIFDEQIPPANIKTDVTSADDVATIPQVKRGTPQRQKEWKKQSIRAFSYFLTNDHGRNKRDYTEKERYTGERASEYRYINDQGNRQPYIYLPRYDPTNVIVGIHNNNANDGTQPGVGFVDNGNPRARPNYATEIACYFTSLLEYTTRQIQKQIKILQHNVRVMSAHMFGNYYYEIYHRIMSDMVHSIINIFQNIVLGYKERDYINTIIAAMKNLFEQIRNGGNKNDPYIYAITYALESIDDTQKAVTDIYSTYNKLYTELVVIHNEFNSVIDLLRYNSAKKYMSAYYNDFNDEVTTYFTNVYDRNIKKLPNIPQTLDEYRAFCSKYDLKHRQSLRELRKKLYEHFIPNINIYNYQTYTSNINYNHVFNNEFKFALSFRVRGDTLQITQQIDPNTNNGAVIHEINRLTGQLKQEVSTPDNNIIPNVGYLTFNSQQNGFDPNMVGGVGLFSKEEINAPKLPYGHNGIQIDGRNILDRSPDNDLIERLADYNNEFQLKLILNYRIGSIGYTYNPDYQKNKDDSVLTSIGDYLSTHFATLKYYLIQHILTWFSNLNDNNDSYYIKGDLLDKIKSNIPDNNTALGVLYTIIGKTTDNIISNNIKYYINSASTKIANNMLELQRDSTPYYKLLRGGDGGLLKPDTGFELNFNKLFSDIIDFFTTQERQPNRLGFYNRLKYSSVLMEVEKDPDKQHQVYNIDYNKPSDVVKVCYDIKPGVVDTLVEYGGNVNARNMVSATPIFGAIDNIHPGLVKALLKNGAEVCSKAYKNNTGLTPLEYDIAMYDKHLKYIYNTNFETVSILKNLYMPMYKEIKESIESNPKFENNIILYLENVFPQILLMYNYMLYQHVISYINNWTFDKFKNLKRVLDAYDIIDTSDIRTDTIPLLTVDLHKALKGSSNMYVLERALTRKTKKYSKKGQEFIEKNIQGASIQKEIEEIDAKNNPTAKERHYRDQLQELLDNVVDERAVLERDATGIVGTATPLSANMYGRSEVLYNTISERIRDYLTSFGVFNMETVAMYEKIFNTVLNVENDITLSVTVPGLEDYGLYNSMWNLYINDNKKLLNITNIHILMVLLQSKILKGIQKNKSILEYNDAIEKLNVIKTLYDDVFDFIINYYRTLPQKYNKQKNFALKDIMDIIIHTVKHIISSNLYFAILKSVYAYVKSINPKGTTIDDDVDVAYMYLNANGNDDGRYERYLRSIVDRIVNMNYGPPGRRNYPPDTQPLLKDFIIDDMSRIVVKMQLDIYDDNDTDKKFGSIEEMFGQIDNILMSSEVISITNDSSLITNLNEYVYPYYRHIFETVIPKMKSLIDNYCNYITNEHRHMEIMISLLKRAVKEM